MSYPRVLVVSLARINASDTANNGFLMRNLFCEWPKENLGQIYSSGDNGDEGFFKHYYQLGSQDRQFGNFFYKQKEEALQDQANELRDAHVKTKPSLKTSFKYFAKKFFVNTGIYELIFRPILSSKMQSWVNEFQPEIIFAQGYNLTFTWLPVMLKESTCSRLAFFPTDDWFTYIYSGQHGEPQLFSWLVRYVVKRATSHLLSNVNIPFAFGQTMTDEYEARYGIKFITINHADDPRRFEEASQHRYHPEGIFTIVTAGYFNRYRWPLLLDANECCRLLSYDGIQVRIVVLSAGIDPAGVLPIADASYIDVVEDPGNELLPQYLKGADLLLLVEGFDEEFVSTIRLSVSSKSHLFMFSHRPIIVYAHQDTGVSNYAAAHEWGRIVTKRDIPTLLVAIRDILTYPDEAKHLISCAKKTSIAFHLLDVNQSRFLNALKGLYIESFNHNESKNIDDIN